jgi:hypothetical protein
MKFKMYFFTSMMALLLIASPAYAGFQWFKGVFVTRVSLVGIGSLQIWGNNGCHFQAGYANQYITGANSSDPSFSALTMAIAMNAQKDGKTLSFYTDCATGEVSQICVNEPLLDSYTC